MFYVQNKYIIFGLKKNMYDNNTYAILLAKTSPGEIPGTGLGKYHEFFPLTISRDFPLCKQCVKYPRRQRINKNQVQHNSQNIRVELRFFLIKMQFEEKTKKKVNEYSKYSPLLM